MVILILDRYNASMPFRFSTYNSCHIMFSTHTGDAIPSYSRNEGRISTVLFLCYINISV